MAEAALEQIDLGKAARAEREGLEDQAFRFRAMGPEAAAVRSRQSTIGDIDNVLNTLQSDLTQLAGVDMQTARQLQGVLENARMQVQAGQMFGPGEFENMIDMAQQLSAEGVPGWTDERIAKMVSDYGKMMEGRLYAEAGGQGQDIRTTRYQ